MHKQENEKNVFDILLNMFINLFIYLCFHLLLYLFKAGAGGPKIRSKWTATKPSGTEVMWLAAAFHPV